MPVLDDAGRLVAGVVSESDLALKDVLDHVSGDLLRLAPGAVEVEDTATPVPPAEPAPMG